MPLVVQVVVTGLAAGAVYGLVATGYALVYRLTGVVHLAIGELVGLSAFITLAVAAGSGPLTQENVDPGRFALALLAGVGVAILSGALVYVAVRPSLRRRSTLGWIGTVVALAFAVRGLLEAAFTREAYVFPDPIPFHRLGRDGLISLGGGASVQVRTFFVIAVGVGLAALGSWFLRRTRVGVALQAIAADPGAARLLGLPVDALLILAFAAAGAVGAVAMVVAAPGAPLTVQTGVLLGLKGLVAALVAGFGSTWQAFLAGLGVGLLESAVATGLGGEWRHVIPLAVALAVVAIRHRTEGLVVE